VNCEQVCDLVSEFFFKFHKVLGFQGTQYTGHKTTTNKSTKIIL